MQKSFTFRTSNKSNCLSSLFSINLFFVFSSSKVYDFVVVVVFACAAAAAVQINSKALLKQKHIAIKYLHSYIKNFKCVEWISLSRVFFCLDKLLQHTIPYSCIMIATMLFQTHMVCAVFIIFNFYFLILVWMLLMLICFCCCCCGLIFVFYFVSTIFVQQSKCMLATWRCLINTIRSLITQFRIIFG